MPKTEGRAAVKKRILEAEKVVVSNILHRWRKEYGMDYVLVVQNGPGDIFKRARIDAKNKDAIRHALMTIVMEGL